MAVKLLDSKLEMMALRTITTGSNKTANAMLLSQLHPDFFYDDVAKETFQRILNIVARDTRIPNWDDLLVDPILPAETREELENYNDIKPTARDRRIHKMYDNLDHYRKMRTIFLLSEENQRLFSESRSIDVEELLTHNVDELLKAQISTRKKDQIITVGGKNDNSNDLFESLMSDERADVIRTGFKTFDSRNGGIAKGSLMIVAATTGGGKTAMKTQFEVNMAEGGYRVCGVPLEMTGKESLARNVANVSRVDVKKYLYTTMTKKEKRHTREAWQNWKQRNDKLGGYFRIFEPEEDMSIEEILTLLRPYNDDVIIIDYIGLLKGVDGDDSWRQLSKAARYAKIWAKNNNRVVILLAQLSDEGAIRYSKGIMEHANNMWSWTYGDKNRETGIIDIMQPKARNQEAFEFQLMHDFSTMRIFDLEDADAMDDVDREERRDRKGRRNADRMREAVNEVRDDYEKSKEKRSRKKGDKDKRDRRDAGRGKDRDRDKGKSRKGRDRYLKDRSA